MKTYFRVISLFLSIALTLSCLVMPAYAYSDTDHGTSTFEYTSSTGGVMYVTLASSVADSLSFSEINALVESSGLSAGETLTIHDVDYCDEPVIEETSSEENSGTYGLQTFVVTGYTGESEEYAAESYFIISVAKGMTISLSSTKTYTANAQVTAGTPLASAQLASSLTAKYTVTLEFSGPPESSSYNSREYRVRFYRVEKSWVQHEYTYGGAHCDTKQGTVTVPTKYLMYSIDHLVTG